MVAAFTAVTKRFLLCGNGSLRLYWYVAGRGLLHDLLEGQGHICWTNCVGAVFVWQPGLLGWFWGDGNSLNSLFSAWLSFFKPCTECFELVVQAIPVSTKADGCWNCLYHCLKSLHQIPVWKRDVTRTKPVTVAWGQIQEWSYFLEKGFVCFILKFALPPFSPPLPSGVQI